MPENESDSKSLVKTFVLLFARDRPTCDISYLTVQRNNENSIYPMLLTTTFYFMRDLVDYRAISLDDSVYIIGGRYASTGRLSCQMFKYDAEIDHWRACDTLKAPRFNFGVTTFDHKIYVLGGEGLKETIIQTVECYDPATDRWKELGNLPKPRRYHSTCAVGKRLWSCGGQSSILEAQTTNELVILDPRPSEWRRSMMNYTLPQPRQQHCLINTDNSVIILGGCEKSNDTIQNIQTISQAIDQRNNVEPQWKELKYQLQYPRIDCGYFQLDRYLYIIGGHNSDNQESTKMIERINLDSFQIEDVFQLEKELATVDCCIVQTNKYNNSLLPLAEYLDKWVVW